MLQLNVTLVLIRRDSGFNTLCFACVSYKTFCFFYCINVKFLRPKINELKWIANKNKAAISGITKLKLDHAVPHLGVKIPLYDILHCIRNGIVDGLASYIRIYVLMQEFCILKKLRIWYLIHFNQTRNQLL